MGAHPRPVPPDFRDLGPALTLVDACKHWKAGYMAVHRWHRECGTTFADYDRNRSRKRPLRPVPADFAERAPTMLVSELRAHYDCSPRTIRRWLSEAGVQSRPVDRAALAYATHAKRRRNPRPVAKPRPKPIVWQKTPNKIPERDFTLQGQAADHLRCATRAPVYRCWNTGRANPKGDWWRLGNVVLSADQLLERAKSKGWEARF